MMIDRRTLLAGISATVLAPARDLRRDRHRRRRARGDDSRARDAGVSGGAAGRDPALYACARSAARLAARQSAEEREFLLPDIGARPEVGRLTGRGNTANLELVLALKPDLILDIGYANATYVRSPIACSSRPAFPTRCSMGASTRSRRAIARSARSSAAATSRDARALCRRHDEDHHRPHRRRAERQARRAFITRADRAGLKPGSAARSMSRRWSWSAHATLPRNGKAASPMFRSNRCCCGIPTSSSPSIRTSPRTCATIRAGRRSRRCVPAACICRPSCRSAGSIFRRRSIA